MHLEHYFNDSFAFAGENGLNVGVVYENFKNESHHLDPSYGYFRFLEHEWGYNEDGERWEIFEYLETEPCTRTRLGLEVD